MVLGLVLLPLLGDHDLTELGFLNIFANFVDIKLFVRESEFVCKVGALIEHVFIRLIPYMPALRFGLR